MRFRNILKDFKRLKKNLHLDRIATNSNMVTVSNFNILMDTMLELHKYPSLKNYFTPIEKEFYFKKTIGNELNITETKFSQLYSVVTEVNKALDLLINFMSSNIEEQDSNTVSFKLFEMNSFEEFSKFNDDMLKIILRPLVSCNINIEMGELEEGSRWQSFIIKSTCALYLFLSICRASYDFIIHDIQKERVLDEIINTYKEMGKDIDEFKQIIKKQNEDKLNNAINTVISDFSEYKCSEEENDEYELIKEKLETQELKNELQFSITTMSSYIDKGLEIYQALDVPEEKRFPLPDYHELLEQKNQKLLNDSN